MIYIAISYVLHGGLNSSTTIMAAEKEERLNRLVEINVIEQVRNLCKTKVVQKALEKKSVQVHGWVYDMHDGRIKELTRQDDPIEAVHPIFRYAME